MVLWDIFDALSPHARVLTAVAPFVFTMLLRLVMGRTTLTRYAISASTLWFLVNVLMAPYSQGMTDDLQTITRFFIRR
jgi:hypothetical protein